MLRIWDKTIAWKIKHILNEIYVSKIGIYVAKQLWFFFVSLMHSHTSCLTVFFLFITAFVFDLTIKKEQSWE